MAAIHNHSEGFFGRKVLYATPPRQYTWQTVGAILDDLLPRHLENSRQIDYLYWFYRGEQAVLDRVKTVRPEINNIVVENRAHEIVEFKKGYEFSHPLQYTNAGQNDLAPIDVLNAYARLDSKESKDLELAEWMYIAGSGYRICLPNRDISVDDAPYYSGVLDPRTTFVVYSNDVQKRRIISGSYTKEKVSPGLGREQYRLGVYAGGMYFEWLLNSTSQSLASTIPVSEKPSPLGVPVVEYAVNSARLGYVELCLHLFNAVNTLDSNRTDALEQFVQALLVFVNCDLPNDDDGNPVVPRSGDAIVIKGTQGLAASVQYLVEQLDQGGTQITKDDLLEAIYEICGVPSRQNRNTGGGDTGQAVVLRNGWGSAEARAKSTEKLFKQSEMEFLRLVLRICRDTPFAAKEIADLTLRDIDISFTRNRSDAMQTKAQALQILLACGVNPEDAYEYCEMFNDSAAVWRKSWEWQKKHSAPPAHAQIETAPEPEDQPAQADGI